MNRRRHGARHKMIWVILFCCGIGYLKDSKPTQGSHNIRGILKCYYLPSSVLNYETFVGSEIKLLG